MGDDEARALPDLRAVDVADVYKNDTIAGRLHRDGDDVVFRYSTNYLDADPDVAPQVSWSLPRSQGETRASAGSIPTFFAGLLPEGVRLRAVVAGTRTSEDDHLTLLLAVGHDTIGDVRVTAEGESPVARTPTIAEDRTGEVDLRAVFDAAVSPSASFERVALPGVQPKVSAAMISTPIGTTAGAAILKLNPDRDYPRLVENEHFFLSMAAGCGLRVPTTRLVHDRNGRSGLLVERFDRVSPPNGDVRRLPQEDACQLLDAYPASKYRLKTEDVARAIRHTVRAGGSSPLLALREVLSLVAFSYLIGNGDLHGKNFSVRQRVDGLWEATPAYDLVCTQPYLSWSDPMALSFYGRANKLDRDHLLTAADRLGLPGRAARSTLDRICEAAPEWLDRIDRIGFDDRTTVRLQRLIEHRLRELQGDSR